MKKFLLSLLATTITVTTMAQVTNFSQYQKKLYIHVRDTLPYRILLPLHYDKTKKYPLLIFLHGSGERGNDNEAQLSHGGSLFLEDSLRESFQAIIVFPQCPANGFWSNVKITTDTSRHFTFIPDGEPTPSMKLLLGLLEQLQHTYKIDKHSIYAGGLSMGGMGTFELVRRRPTIFAAAFSICGGADTTTAPEIKYTAWWLFHGLKDNVVDPQFSIEMNQALKKAGADVQLTLYPNDNHNSWDDALAERNLLPWLFSIHR